MSSIHRSFPRELDGATVLYAAKAMPGTYSHGTEVVSYYALAQYSGDEPRIYLFFVSAELEVIGDFLEDSIDDAMDNAENSFDISKDEWVKL